MTNGNGLHHQERTIDVSTMLEDWNPLTGSHLMAWGSDSDDEDASQLLELPAAGLAPEYAPSWEDAVLGGGLESQPWIDYRYDSDGEEVGVAVRPGARAGEAAAAAAGPSSAYSAEAGFQELPPHELAERLATGQVALVLDVRSRAEWEAEGHIAGAVCLPLDPELSQAVRAGELDEYRTRPVVVVCGSGRRSAQAAVRLSKVFGFKNVTNAAGGMAAWQAAGGQVQRAPPRPAGGSGTGGCGCGGSGGGGCQNGKK
ncbi:hypothetical protein HYH02_000158 [Chlamydomonas schloesseri]|uniref:Rhodanese domain-containing protein n=1 Tax=Chlamydomonas schloesseri TaxID=2026947 RepID=A0A836B856_9CHLO|nr:hypothetical protein HYH02_000158 [Chlamydomonas schloesseri]|eukprot:KAG2450054.1 hypothetical protein HYH02_000158 [Chlamydomonas schloesseri]